MNDRIVRVAYAIIYADRQTGQTLSEQADTAGRVLGCKPDDCLAWAHERRVEVIFGGRKQPLDWDVYQSLVRLASMDYHLPASARHAPDPITAVEQWNEHHRTTVGPWNPPCES